MTIHSDPLAGDPLAWRLYRLNIPTPPYPGHARQPRHRVVRSARAPRRAVAVAMAVAAVGLITVTAFAGTLANLTSAALQAAGLASRQVTPLEGSAQTGGFKLQVTGGYADQLSTVVFAQIDQPCPNRPDSGCDRGFRTGPYLTDQFGLRYEITGGEGIGVGPYPMFFEPLRGDAAEQGARLTLHLPILLPSGATELRAPLAGTMSPRSARSLPVPASISDPGRGVTYTVVSIEYSGTYLEVRTRLTGNLDTVIAHLGSNGEVWPGVFLLDSAGHRVMQVAGISNGNWQGVVNSDPRQEPQPSRHLQDETRIFTVAKPGTYRLAVLGGLQSDKQLAEWVLVIR